MGRDRRKRDRRQTADVDNVGNNVEVNTTTDAQTPLEPRGQREPRNKAGQNRKEVVKQVAPVTEKTATEPLSEKKEETKEASPDPAVLFANLKRETDEIKALTEKKFSKRQIFSNWSRYDEPLPDPVQEEEELPGADFQALCGNITSESNYFQLKLERSWDTDITSLSSELFSLNADILAVGLGSIPFYERLDLPVTLFSETEVQKMKSSAKSFKSQYGSQYSNKKILNILRERSNAEDNLPLKAEREKTPDHKPTLSFNIDRPETPDEFERGVLTEVYEQAHNIPPRATRFSAEIARKGTPEIVNKAASKIPETNMTPQDLRTNRSSLEKQESDLQEFKENTKRHSAEISFNTISQRKERNTSPECFVEDRRSPELVENVESSGKEIFEEINGDNTEKLNVTFQRQSVSPENEKKPFDNETNDSSSEISSIAIQQSEPDQKNVVEESTPEPVPETLPPRQMNKSKSKEKRKRHNLEMGSTSGIPAASEAASPEIESDLKSESETVPNVAVNEDMKSQEEVQKPLASGESLGQRSKKRRSKEKGQLANKHKENTKMPLQKNPKFTNTLAEEKSKPLAQEIVAEKAKSPSPEKPSVKPHSASQTKPSEIVKPKQEKVAEPVKAVQKKSLEKVKLKEEKPVQKVIVKEEKPIEKVKPREEKVKAPAEEKAVEKTEDDYDDLDFLLTLRTPIKESQVTPGTSTQVSKSSIEEDNACAKPTVFKFEEENLEEWLDSVLED